MKRTKRIVAIILAIICTLSLTMTAFASEQSTMNITETAEHTKAIVIIPGILGSTLETTSGTEVWLSFINYGKMALKEDGTSVNSIRSANYDNYGAYDTYKTLYNSLNDAFGSAFDVIFFDYDFRLTNSTAATKLATELSDYDEVVLVAHSMGGLVAAKFLDNSSANRAKTVALISLGTPYVGAAKCINVMETGDMLRFPGLDFTIFGNTIRDMSKNCYAAYQLLPTSKYYSITGTYPLSVNGTNYSTVMTQLQNTAWGKKSDGTVKPMFSTATTFHSSLINSNTHIINHSDVTTYTIAATGEDTISKVSMDSNYEITALTYSNAGDETVLQKSSGYGVPDYTYSGTTHTGMVSDSRIISRVKTLITSETGVAAANYVGNGEVYDYETSSVEISSSKMSINERGWIVGLNNKRINIYTDNDSSLIIDGFVAIEENDRVLDRHGNKIGSVWKLGNTGRKMYALYDGEYQLAVSGYTKIEYMDNGYYEKAVEYDSANDTMSIHIEDFTTQAVNCIINNEQNAAVIQPLHIYSETELLALNMD